MENKINAFFQLLAPNQKILHACSGGPDSMALSHFYASNGYDFAIAICDFQLREVSKEEVQLVKAFAEKHSIPFFSIAFDTKTIAKKWKVSTQEAARKLRYDWFFELLEKHNFSCISTAHHANDQAETILWNAVRGSGLQGLAGIKAIQPRLIRPMLTVPKQAVYDYIEQHKVPHAIDQTNFESKYTRNSIRLETIPSLEKVQKGTVGNLVKVGQRCLEIDQLVSFYTNSFKQQHKRRLGLVQYYSLADLPKEVLSASFFYYLFREENLSWQTLVDISDHCIHKTWKGTFEGALSWLELKSGKVFFIAKSQLERLGNSQYLINMVSEVVETAFGNFIISSQKPTSFSVPLSHKQVSKGLLIRAWKSGDRLSMGENGTQKVKKIFTDHKLPKLQKDTIPIIEFNGAVISCFGLKNIPVERDTAYYLHQVGSK